MLGISGCRTWCRYSNWKHGCAKPLSAVFHDVEHILKFPSEGGTRFAFECCGVGHIDALAQVAAAGSAKALLVMQIIFWIRGGNSAQVKHLMHMKHTADRLLGDDNPGQCSAAGVINTLLHPGGDHGRQRARRSGGWLLHRPGQACSRQANQVREVRGIIEELSREVATLEQALGIPALNRASQVAF